VKGHYIPAGLCMLEGAMNFSAPYLDLVAAPPTVKGRNVPVRFVRVRYIPVRSSRRFYVPVRFIPE
jgi:hypothetical protein